jgi:ABC-type transport system involved in cytochrome c biogenesis permease component
MTVLPIVGRELVVAARRAATYWTRFYFAAMALGIFLFLKLIYRGAASEMGHQVFNLLGYVALAFATLAGVFLTADSLAAEKREGTLGLLFLTDLRGYDVVLGKMAASSLLAIFGLLAVFPVLALPLLMGGVSGGEFWRTLLVFVVALYFSLSAGMLVSAVSQDGRHALAGTFAMVTITAGVLPLLWEVLTQTFHRAFPDYIIWPSPYYAYVSGFDTAYLTRGGRREFWGSLSATAMLATGGIAVASVILPRSWQKTSSSVTGGRRAARPGGAPGQKAPRRPAMETANPAEWLAQGDRAGPTAVNRTMYLLLVLWLACVGVWSANHNSVFDPITVFFVFGMHLAAKVLIAAESSRRLHDPRQSGALELLLVTPLPVQAIVQGQQNTLRAQFRRALLGLCLINLLTLNILIRWDSGLSMPSQSMERNTFIEIFLGGALMLWLDAAALAWVGMWKGLKSKKYSRAVLATLAQVTGAPWLAFALFIFLATISPARFNQEHFYILFALWFCVGVAIDLVSILDARTKLAAEFRAVVAQRHGG